MTNQIIYKYRVWEEKNSPEQFSRRILTENEIYFAAPEQFNDPFDCAVPFKYKEETLTEANIYLKLRQLAKYKFPDASESDIENLCFNIQKQDSIHNEDTWRTFNEYFKELLNTTFGIFSTTPRKDNLLMWSHYADSHTGFCVGLDRKFIFDLCKPFVQMGPVVYQEEFPQIDIAEDATTSMIKLLMTKSVDWLYEREYRFFRYGNKKAIKIPNEAIKEIIVGHKMKDEHKKHVYSLYESKFKHSQFYETQLNMHSFKLDFLPIIKS